MTQDEGITAVREVRKKISAAVDNDPERLVAYYMEQQKQHADRLYKPSEQRQRNAADGAATGR